MSVCMCMYVWVRMCMCVGMRVCVCVCVCVAQLPVTPFFWFIKQFFKCMYGLPLVPEVQGILHVPFYQTHVIRAVQFNSNLYVCVVVQGQQLCGGEQPEVLCIIHSKCVSCVLKGQPVVWGTSYCTSVHVYNQPQFLKLSSFLRYCGGL